MLAPWPAGWGARGGRCGRLLPALCLLVRPGSAPEAVGSQIGPQAPGVGGGHGEEVGRAEGPRRSVEDLLLVNSWFPRQELAENAGRWVLMPVAPPLCGDFRKIK